MELEGLEGLYTTYKPLVFSIAYHMLGSTADAEDAVQDTFTAVHLTAARGEEISHPKAFLSRIVTNRCLDLLKSARRKRELYVGPWLPEPIVQGELPGSPGMATGPAEAAGSAEDPFQAVLLEETLSYAFLVMLERLTPIERAVFVLREAFDYDYRDIAGMTERTEAGCRKIYSRLRSKIQAVTPPEEPPSLEACGDLAKRFLYAAHTGSMDSLLSMLTDDIVLVSDGGGKALAALNPISTPQHVAGFLLGLASKMSAVGTVPAVRLIRVNGGVGLLFGENLPDPTVICFEMEGDRYRRIYLVRNPDKLRHILPQSG